MNMKNPLIYAYIGDSIYETFVRKYLIEQNIGKIKALQHESLNYVSAKSQRRIYESLENANQLTTKEIEIAKWGRNAKGHKSSSTDIVTYRIATGLECLIGYLYLENNIERLNEIMHFILK